MTWDNVTSNCTIETPTILFDGSRKNLPVNYNLTGNDGVWVGYYLAATAFHYIGTLLFTYIKMHETSIIFNKMFALESKMVFNGKYVIP
jgi:hypothetical protein